MLVPVRQLKAQLSRVLASARAGETVEVTSHNKPIARIVGIPPAGDGLQRLAASAALTLPAGKPVFADLVDLAHEGRSLGEIVREQRG